MQNAIQPLVHMLMSTLLWVVPLMVVVALLVEMAMGLV